MSSELCLVCGNLEVFCRCHGGEGGTARRMSPPHICVLKSSCGEKFVYLFGPNDLHAIELALERQLNQGLLSIEEIARVQWNAKQMIALRDRQQARR